VREFDRAAPVTRTLDVVWGGFEVARERAATLPRPDVAALGRSIARGARSVASRTGTSTRAVRARVSSVSLPSVPRKLRTLASSLPSIPSGLRDRLGARRGLLLIGGGAAALVVVIVLLVVLLPGGGDGTSDGGSTAPGTTDVAPEVRFPPSAATPADPVARVRPVAVRNVAIDFEAAIAAALPAAHRRG
jgi:hypothetical protein